MQKPILILIFLSSSLFSSLFSSDEIADNRRQGFNRYKNATIFYNRNIPSQYYTRPRFVDADDDSPTEITIHNTINETDPPQQENNHENNPQEN